MKMISNYQFYILIYYSDVLITIGRKEGLMNLILCLILMLSFKGENTLKNIEAEKSSRVGAIGDMGRERQERLHNLLPTVRALDILR